MTDFITDLVQGALDAAIGGVQGAAEQSSGSSQPTGEPPNQTRTQTSNSAWESPNYGKAGGPNAFRDYASLVNIAEIESNTLWNPPLPRVLSNPEFDKYSNPKGWFAADPMRITGYELQPPNDTPDELPQDTDAPDLFEFDKRKYGFRFLFNPPTASEAYTNLNQVDPIAFVRGLSEVENPVLSMQSGASMNLELFLSRVDDMRILNRPNWSQYYDNLSEEDAEGIRTRGTMYDLEFLFRLCNGKSVKTWWTDGLTADTSDWGIFLPRPLLISLGGGEKTAVRIRGLISSISIQHVMFSPGMIPTLTQLTVSIERLLDQMTRGVAWNGVESDAYSSADSPAKSSANSTQGIIGDALSGIQGAIDSRKAATPGFVDPNNVNPFPFTDLGRGR